MRSLIYFPGFEPDNIDWLKFALLYLDKVEPIVPESADVQLTDTFRDLRKYTDLITLYRPSYQEGDRATADAIEQVERVLRRPAMFSRIFGTDCIDQEWKYPDPNAVELWGEKFSYTWEQFCLENRFGQKSDHGIIIPRSLATVYMTILANCIADSRGISPISDEAKVNDFSLFVRRSDSSVLDHHVSLLKIELPIILPENLTDIDMKSVIKLRNADGFAKRRWALQDAIQHVADAIERGNDDASLKDELSSSFRDFSDDIARLGAGLASVGFSMWLVGRGADFEALDAVGQALVGTAFTVDGVIAIRNTWTNTYVNRLARRYLMDVNKLASNAKPA